MTTKEITELHNKYIMPTYEPNLVLVKGQGTHVWDSEGKEYLDFLAGISVLNVGHCHPKVVNAIKQQASKLMHVSNLYYNEQQPELGRVLSEKALNGKCFFCNSGAEANEALIKLARLWGRDNGKYEIITMHNSFHGRTLATLTATGQQKVQLGFEPLPPGFVLANFNDLDSCREAISAKTVAILVETIQGEGGVLPSTQEFMTGLRKLCDEHNILLLCDEVQTGMGRTGRWFGYQHHGIKPDAISLAKALGGGFPIGAVVTGEKLADVFHPGQHASTFGGTPLACAAALATISAIEEDAMCANAEKQGSILKDGLEQIAIKYDWIEKVRGLGLMLGLVLNIPAKPLQDKLREMGLLTLATAGNVLRFLPPLNVTSQEVKTALSIVENACENLN